VFLSEKKLTRTKNAHLAADEPVKKCFRSQNQLFYGHVKKNPEKEGSWIRHGVGKLIASRGNDEEGRITTCVYEGWFEEDKISGNGVYSFQDGSVYVGDMVDGIVHGNGRMTWPDGSVYEGSFVDADMHGQGKFVDVKGETMEGEFQRNSVFFRGEWINILEVIRFHETEALLQLDDDVDVQIPVFFCLPNTTDLYEMVQMVMQRDNLIPLIVADSETKDPLCNIGDNTLYVGHAVDCRRRAQNYKKLFQAGVERALKDNIL